MKRVSTLLLTALLLFSLILNACGSRSAQPSESSKKKNDSSGSFGEHDSTDSFGQSNRSALGNTPGNLSTFGFAAGQGDEIYFSPINEDGCTEIYKATPRDDGGYDCETLKTGGGIFPWNINVADGWIYHYDLYEEEEDKGYFALCAMRTDGSDRRTVVKWEITDRSSEFIDDRFSYMNMGTFSFVVKGDWIYYPNYFDGFKLYAVKTDGSRNHKLCDDVAGYLNLVGDQIYYLCAKDREHLDRLCVVRTDGSGRRELNLEIPDYAEAVKNTVPENLLPPKTVACLNVVGDWIYYYASFQICAAKIDGSDSRVLYDFWQDYSQKYSESYSLFLALIDHYFFMNVSDGWIYFPFAASSEERLTALTTDGSRRFELPISNAYFAVVGNRFVYMDDEGDVFVMEMDSNRKEQLYSPLGVNDELTSEIGMSFGEIRKKYGEVTVSDGWGGGAYYRFQSSPGSYFFRDHSDTSYFVDRFGNLTEPPDDAVCFTILTDVKHLFHDFRTSLTVQQLQDKLGWGVYYHEGDPDYEAAEGVGGPNCSFAYGDCQITIEMDRGFERIISEDDPVSIVSLR